MNENIMELFNFCHKEVPAMCIENKITELMELHSQTIPLKDKEEFKELYNVTKTAILNLANCYIEMFNETPHSYGVYRK